MKLKFIYILTLLLFELNSVLSEKEPDEDSIYSDPGKYYAKVKHNRRRKLKKKHRNQDLSASGSSYKKKSKLKYAFLQPEDSATQTKKSGDDCHPQNGVFNAFTFLNFALSAATLTGNLVANVNSNNRNNNNNNNNNNLNTNNINLNSNNNGANNNNAIMIPVGKKKRRKKREDEHLALKNINKFVKMEGHENLLFDIVDDLLPHISITLQSCYQ